MRARSLEKWTVGRSAELYGVDNWGGGYFRAMPGGELAITPFADKSVCVSIPSIISGLEERGLGLPVLLRIENLLDAQISLLHESFTKAIDDLGYGAEFRGVYVLRSEERRVGKECRSRWSPYH